MTDRTFTVCASSIDTNNIRHGHAWRRQPDLDREKLGELLI